MDLNDRQLRTVNTGLSGETKQNKKVSKVQVKRKKLKLRRRKAKKKRLQDLKEN